MLSASGKIFRVIGSSVDEARLCFALDRTQENRKMAAD